MSRSKNFYNLSKNDGKKAELLIYGEIGSGWFSEVTAEIINEELKLIGEVEEIDVRLHSPGGSVFEGVAIYSALKNHKAKINVIIDGYCASIATVIAMAGDSIEMGLGTTFMVHNPLTVTQGNADELKKMADTLNILGENMIDIYMTRFKGTREEMKKMMDEETWLDPQSALEKGFINQIGKFKMKEDIVALDMSHFKNFDKFIAKNKTEDKGNELLKMLSSIKSFFETDKEEKGKVKMTKEQFMKEQPEMFKEILAQGASEERKRFEEIEGIEATSEEAKVIIANAKFKEPKSAGEIALAILNLKPIAKATTGKVTGFEAHFEAKKEDSQIVATTGNVEMTAEQILKQEEDEYVARMTKNFK